jgi:hypothetical protein
MIGKHDCAGKHQHPSTGKAEAHLRQIVREKGVDSRNFRIYLCPLCGHYHVGRKKVEGSHGEGH